MPGFIQAGVLLALFFATVPGALAQYGGAPPPADASGGAALSSQEQSEFDARLRAAATDQERVRIRAEREALIQVRIQGQQAVIPPSPRESSNDLIMPDVPTPPLRRGFSGDPLPGGALSDTGAGTNPLSTPGGPGNEGRDPSSCPWQSSC